MKPALQLPQRSTIGTGDMERLCIGALRVEPPALEYAVPFAGKRMSAFDAQCSRSSAPLRTNQICFFRGVVLSPSKRTSGSALAVADCCLACHRNVGLDFKLNEKWL